MTGRGHSNPTAHRNSRERPLRAGLAGTEEDCRNDLDASRASRAAGKVSSLKPPVHKDGLSRRVGARDQQRQLGTTRVLLGVKRRHSSGVGHGAARCSPKRDSLYARRSGSPTAPPNKVSPPSLKSNLGEASARADMKNESSPQGKARVTLTSADRDKKSPKTVTSANRKHSNDTNQLDEKLKDKPTVKSTSAGTERMTTSLHQVQTARSSAPVTRSITNRKSQNHSGVNNDVSRVSTSKVLKDSNRSSNVRRSIGRQATVARKGQDTESSGNGQPGVRGRTLGQGE